MQESLTGKIREAAQEMGKGGAVFSATDLADRVGVQTNRDKQRMHWMMKDLKKRGVLVSVAVGVYRLSDQPKEKRAPQKREVMWKFLRMRKTVSAGDLQEASGVSRNYALHWLRLLERRGLVKAAGKGRWMLVKDVVETPEDVEKAEKLRELRARRKEQAMACLEGIGSLIQSMETSLLSARSALNSAQAWVAEVEA